MKDLIRNSLCIILICACALTYCDKGDVFLFGSVLTDPTVSGGPAFGGEAGVQLGANEKTDFQLSANVNATPGYFGSTGSLNARYLLTSYFTPYFGDIRPRLGGSVGLNQVLAHGGVNDVLFNAGVHLQGLVALNPNVLLFGEVNPNMTFGDGGNFSTLIKLGILFRLSK
jgi:hypothetical protein